MACYRPVRRRKRKRRKRKRKTPQEGKTNEGDSSDDDSGADDSVEKLSEEGAQGKDGQGNLQCPSCRRQGGHITSLAGLAKAQFDRMDAGGLQRDVPGSGDGESGTVGTRWEENSFLARSIPRDADLTHECSANRDVVLESCSQNGSVAREELDENGNSASMHQQLGGFFSRPGECKDGGDEEDKLPSITDDMIQMTTPETGIRKKVTFDLDLSRRRDIFDLEIADSTAIESISNRETDDLLINGSEREVANIDVESGDGDSWRSLSVSAPEAFSCDTTRERSVGDGGKVTAIRFSSDDALIQKITLGPASELSLEVTRPASELSQEVARPASELSQEVTRPASELSQEIARPASELSQEVARPASELSQEVTRPASELSQEVARPASELSGEIREPGSELQMVIAEPASELSLEVARPASDRSQQVAWPASELSLEVTGPASELSQQVARPASELSLQVTGPASELSLEVARPASELSGEISEPGSELQMAIRELASEMSLEVTRPASELPGEICEPGSELPGEITELASELSHVTGPTRELLWEIPRPDSILPGEKLELSSELLGEIAEPATELSQEIARPASELHEAILELPGDSTYNGSVTPSQVGTECQPDDDRWASEITTDVEASHDPCPAAAMTDDEKWTEMFEKSEVLRGDIEPASGDAARPPKQRRRPEKVRSDKCVQGVFNLV